MLMMMPRGSEYGPCKLLDFELDWDEWMSGIGSPAQNSRFERLKWPTLGACLDTHEDLDWVD